MNKFLIFGGAILSVWSNHTACERPNFRTMLEQRINYECSIHRSLGDEFLIRYESLKALDELNAQMRAVTKELQQTNELACMCINTNRGMSEQLNKVADVCALYTEQQKKVQVPVSTPIFDVLNTYIHDARQTRIIRTIEGSTKLQVGIAVVALLGIINTRLLTLHTCYCSAHDDEQKQAYKRSYKRWAGAIQKIINIEKFFTCRIRDASIGFWGSGNFVKSLFGTLCDWCSLGTLFFIDTALLD